MIYHYRVCTIHISGIRPLEEHCCLVSISYYVFCITYFELSYYVFCISFSSKSRPLKEHYFRGRAGGCLVRISCTLRLPRWPRWPRSDQILLILHWGEVGPQTPNKGSSGRWKESDRWSWDTGLKFKQPDILDEKKQQTNINNIEMQYHQTMSGGLANKSR